MNNDAITLNTLLAQAESLVRQQHTERSRLVKQALNRHLDRCNGDTVTQSLNAIYAERPSQLDTGWRRLQTVTLSWD